MSRVDFYLLPLSEPHGRLSFACRLAERAFREGHRVYLHVPGADDASTLDALLWSFRAASFVPHDAPGSAAAEPPAAVAIGCDGDPGSQRDVLINLGDTVPDFCERFERIAEIVLNDPPALQASRSRWSRYRTAGHALAHHDMQYLRPAGE